MNFPLVLLSFGVGLLIGLTSMGGAALMTPVLILILGVRPVVAVGTDLAYTSITKIVGAWAHWRQGTADVRLSLRLAFTSVPGGLLGVWSLSEVRRRGYDADIVLRKALGAVLILAAAVMIIRIARTRPINFVHPWAVWLRKWGAPIWAGFTGFCVGLTSVGSGSLLAPFLLMLYPQSTVRLIGTDVFHAAILVTSTAGVHLYNGHVNWEMMPMLLLGSIPGVFLGARLSPRLPVRWLQLGLAALLLFGGYRLLGI
jgi:uncharacterized membrane protein YfcA